MMTSKELTRLGVPNDKRIMPLAMRLVNVALAEGALPEELASSVRALCDAPEGLTADPVLGPLALAMQEHFPEGMGFKPRETPAPWQQWGDVQVEESAVRQMENACSLPNAVRGALMPDAHTGYGLPIGGVLAVRNAVIPYAVGVDIACRMRLSILDRPVTALADEREALVAALERETRFGIGASFEYNDRRKHAVLDEDWSVTHVTRAHKDKAWKQLGSSGGGNHFVEFGELHLEAPVELGGKRLEQGVYLALLSHSGSRGAGEAVAKHYSALAKSLRPGLPQEISHLAWLDLDTEEGQEYWAAMELMGHYAAANHELIHAHVLAALGAEAVTHVENHHNFAWREEHEGETVVVHRKGATPAGEGIQGIVPGSMGASGFVVQGKGNKAALNSCSHGAGRLMSRAAAFKSVTKEALAAFLQERGVELLSGGLDEAPMVYKDIHAVMAAQSDLVDILARFEPRLVKMAPESGECRFRKKKGR